MADEIADAIETLEEYDVEYTTNSMGKVIETDDIHTLLDAVGAAHEAVDADRVSTLLKIDDKRTVEQSAAEKVGAVEAALGRPATSQRDE